MSLSELFKDFIESSKERIKNPIAGTYLISFLIFNWQPILLLLFSTKSIEDRINVVCTSHSSIWAILAPFIIAVLYITIVPYISVFLESTLMNVNKRRQSNKNEEAINSVKLKIDLADIELKLQDKLSRKQEIQELIEKISVLEDKNLKDAETYKALGESYKSQINELTNRLKNSIEIKNTSDLSLQDKLFNNILMDANLPLSDIVTISTLPESTEVPIGIELSKKVKKIFDFNTFWEKKGSLYYMTSAGLDLRLYVVNNYTDPTHPLFRKR